MGWCGAACGDTDDGVSEKTETGGRPSLAPAGGSATGGKATTGGAATTTFGGFESSGGRAASGGSTATTTGGSMAAETGGTSSGECEPLPAPEGAVHDGDLEIASAEDVEGAQGYSEITGTLTVSVPELELPMLARLGGDLTSAGTTTIRLPRLSGVGGRIYYYLDHDIEVLDLRRLETVAGWFYLHRNLGLRELQIDALSEVGGTFEISANLDLPDCFLDVVDTRFSVLHTAAPECTCTRSCGVVRALCN